MTDLYVPAKSESVLIHTLSGDDFVLEEADELDREVAMLGASDKFMRFLNQRSEGKKEVSLNESRKKRGLEELCN